MRKGHADGWWERACRAVGSITRIICWLSRTCAVHLFQTISVEVDFAIVANSKCNVAKLFFNAGPVVPEFEARFALFPFLGVEEARIAFVAANGL